VVTSPDNRTNKATSFGEDRAEKGKRAQKGGALRHTRPQSGTGKGETLDTKKQKGQSPQAKIKRTEGEKALLIHSNFPQDVQRRGERKGRKKGVQKGTKQTSSEKGGQYAHLPREIARKNQTGKRGSCVVGFGGAKTSPFQKNTLS